LPLAEVVEAARQAAGALDQVAQPAGG